MFITYTTQNKRIASLLFEKFGVLQEWQIKIQTFGPRAAKGVFVSGRTFGRSRKLYTPLLTACSVSLFHQSSCKRKSGISFSWSDYPGARSLGSWPQSSRGSRRGIFSTRRLASAAAQWVYIRSLRKFRRFSSNDFHLVPPGNTYPRIEPHEVPKRTVSLTTVAKSLSIGHPERASVKCNCMKRKCKNCTCVTNGSKCSSHCACSISRCTNKDLWRRD